MLRREAVRRCGRLTVCLVVAALIFLIPTEVMSYAQRAALYIFLVAAGLWISEAIPLFATSLLVMGLEVLLLALPGATPELAEAGSYKIFFAAASDPIIALFFGGFLLARAATRYKLDIAMARVLLKPFGERPGALLLGVMTITGLFSMWMSNTAATAMMIAVLGPLLATVEKDDPFRRSLVLAVPFGANLGGIGTPIGTPPNAVAVGVLRAAGYDISFLSWMKMAVPLMVLLMVACWVMLMIIFRPKAKRVDFKLPANFRLPMTAWVVAAVFVATVLLWLTSELHNIPASVVALLPAIIFTALCILDADDVNTLEWNALILIAGGISLGIAIQVTELDRWLINTLPISNLAPILVVAGFCAVALLLSSVMSHTATANLMLPVVAGVGTATLSTVWISVMVTLACSVAMALPISTPPNAIAYATGEVSGRDMLKVGGPLSVFSLVLMLLTGKLVLEFWGLL